MVILKVLPLFLHPDILYVCMCVGGGGGGGRWWEVKADKCVWWEVKADKCVIKTWLVTGGSFES